MTLQDDTDEETSWAEQQQKKWVHNVKHVDNVLKRLNLIGAAESISGPAQKVKSYLSMKSVCLSKFAQCIVCTEVAPRRSNGKGEAGRGEEEVERPKPTRTRVARSQSEEHGRRQSKSFRYHC